MRPFFRVHTPGRSVTCVLSISAALSLTSAASNSSRCRYLPGDPLWPAQEAWADLNATIDGRLVKTVPLGSPCHDPTYNKSDCAILTAGWVYTQTYMKSSSGIVAPYFQNQSCDPFTKQSTPCVLGNEVEYAINVTSAQDVTSGILFAQTMNIRLAIRNTGQDLLGRATGKGAISIWTHYLKNIEFLDHQGSNYSGTAIKMGAGVQGWEAYEAADSRGFRVLGASGATVGLAGGFTQGGGHSDLSSMHGLAADQVLEWEVVTASGACIVASPATNSDLFWALSGGGGSTYGVVISMTVKAFPDGPIGSASLSFAASNISQDTYWNGVTAFHSSLLMWVDQGGSASYTITNESLSLIPATFPGITTKDVTNLVSPLKDKLRSLGIEYNVNVLSFPSYLAYFSHFFGPLPYGLDAAAQVQGGCLVPRSVLQTANANLSRALREVTRGGTFYIIGRGLDVLHGVAGNSAAAIAVLPSWREALMTIVVASVWDYTLPLSKNVAKENQITNVIDPMLRSVTGAEAGVYMNEGDFQQADTQIKFYGSNYQTLRRIKRKYDPDDLFYATTGVGSEAWMTSGDGRLCRSNSL